MYSFTHGPIEMNDKNYQETPFLGEFPFAEDSKHHRQDVGKSLLTEGTMKKKIIAKFWMKTWNQW